jgi:thiol:disulfide interchange protein DsbC
LTAHKTVHRPGALWPATCRIVLLGIALTAAAQGAVAQEAAIRKALAARFPQSPPIDEVTRTPIPGLYEVRSGTVVFYTDRRGDYIVRGEMLDTRHKTNLTQARISKVPTIDFSKLPLHDAIVSTHGHGTRKLAVFADPDCPYCKQLESVLQQRDDITVYTFLIPLLGPQSLSKAKSIWCAKDKDVAWREWMSEGKLPAAQADCNTGALERNLAFGGRHQIRGTPTLVFADGTRETGAPSALELERQLAQHRPAAAATKP